MKKLLKRTAAVAISAAMLFSTAPMTTAFAANNGPVDFSTDMMYYASLIWFEQIDDKGNFVKVDNPDGSYIGGEYVHYDVYSKTETDNTAFNGASYDKSTNTLTLDNVNAGNYILAANAMGNDFKIKVIGNCNLAQITGYGAGYGQSITFIGDGTLTVNQKKLFDYGIDILAYSEANVNFDSGVKVNISGKEGAVRTGANTLKNLSEVFTFKSESNVKTEEENIYDEKYEWVSGYYVDLAPQPDYLGPKAKCLSDPEGIYTMNDYTSTSSDGTVTKGHRVIKYIYSESLGLYLTDPSFGQYRGSTYLEENDQEYSNYEFVEGETLQNEKKRFEEFNYFTVMTDAKGNQYAYRENAWSVDLQEDVNYVVTFNPVSDVSGAYEFKVLYSGDEAKNFAATLTNTNQEINGFVIKDLEPDKDWIGYHVISKDDPDGLYFMTEGSRYENYGKEDEKEIPTRWIRKYIYNETYNVYIQDTNFGDYWNGLAINYDDFDTSGYTLAENEKGVYNYGKITNIYSRMYVDAEGKKYAVDDIKVNGEYVDTAFNYELIPEISTDDEETYLFSIAEGVDVSDLTEYVERTLNERIKNYYITNTDFTYDGGKSAPTLTDISKATVTVSNSTYTGKALTPAPTVKIGGTTLKNGTDYSVAYKNNTNVGTATVTVTGKGSYSGIITKTFTITAKDISKFTATLSAISYTYTGTQRKPTVTLKDGTTALKSGTDYTVTYSNNINKATAKVTITGKGNYTGTINKTFTIKAKALSKTTLSGVSASYKYTGKNITPTVTLKDGTKKLVKNTDYTVTYKNNKAVGTATITIKGKGNYSGTVTKTFKIIPKNVTVKSVTSPKTKQLKVTWTADKTITGYQIQYSTSSTFKSGNKTKTITKNTTTSATLTGLTKGKTYYVRIRAYKKVGSTNVYGSYSAKKSVKIK